MVLRAVETQAELDALRTGVAKAIYDMRGSDPSVKFSDYRDDYAMPALPPVSEVQNELPWRSLLLMI